MIWCMILKDNFGCKVEDGLQQSRNIAESCLKNFIWNMCNEYNTFLELMLGDKANNKSVFSLWVTKEILWKQFFLGLNVQLYCVAKILKKNS